MLHPRGYSTLDVTMHNTPYHGKNIPLPIASTVVHHLVCPEVYPLVMQGYLDTY